MCTQRLTFNIPPVTCCYRLDFVLSFHAFPGLIKLHTVSVLEREGAVLALLITELTIGTALAHCKLKTHTHTHTHTHTRTDGRCHAYPCPFTFVSHCLHSIRFHLSSDYVHKAPQFAWKLIVLCLITQHAITRPLIRLGAQLPKALLCVLFIDQTRPFIAFYFASRHHSNCSLIQRN